MTSRLPLTAEIAACCTRLAGYGKRAGLATALVALSRLLPQRVDGIPDAALQTWNAALRRRCALLFVRWTQPKSASDVESEEERAATAALVRALVTARDIDAGAGADAPALVGTVAIDRVTALAPELERAPLGAALPWMLAAELLGDSVVWRGSASDVPALFRERLVRRLSGLADQSPQVFWKALVADDDPALRDALRACADALHAAVSLVPVP